MQNFVLYVNVYVNDLLYNKYDIIQREKSMNYYDILMLNNDASSEEIEKSYKFLIRKYHPDINDTPLSNKISQELNSAREILSNDQSRKKYDEWLKSCDEAKAGRASVNKHRSTSSTNNSSNSNSSSSGSNNRTSTTNSQGKYVEVSYINEWLFFKMFIKNKSIHVGYRIIFGMAFFAWFLLTQALKLCFGGIELVCIFITSIAMIWMEIIGGMAILHVILSLIGFFLRKENEIGPTIMEILSEEIALILPYLPLIFLPFILSFASTFIISVVEKKFIYYNFKFMYRVAII